MTSPNTESALIAEQLRRAFYGDAWHGPAVLELLQDVDAAIEWDKPIRFRDLAAHWYDEGLDHQLIWNVVQYELPPMIAALEAYLATTSAP